MELREGYKTSEVGLIPIDWDIDFVKNIAEIHTGGKNTQDRIEGGLYPFFVRSQIVERINSYSYDNEAVLTAGDGVGVGKVMHYINGKFDCHQRVYRISNFNGKVSGYYFYLYFGNNFLNRIMQMTAKSSVDSVRMDMIANMQIPIPPTKAEQTAIATALSDADALIEAIEKLIAKKRKIKQGAMQKLLKPKEGWEHKSLGEIGVISGAGVDKLINEDEIPVRLVNYMDVFNSDFIYSKELSHWVTAPKHKANRCAVKQGDVFFTPSSEMRYDIAVSAVAIEDISNAVYSYHLIRLRLTEDWDLNFRTYIFKTRYFLGQAEQVCEGSGKRYVITLPKFRNLKSYYPKTKKEQNEIASILSDMDAEIEALETKLEKYRKIKLGMMQNLLTGKIRLI